MNIEVKVNVSGDLTRALKDLSEIRLDAVINLSLVEMLNRARAPGGTPVKTGQLRDSSGITGNTMGYTKEYAAAVEYGHGNVQGRYYLKANAETQAPIFKKDVEEQIQKILGA